MSGDIGNLQRLSDEQVSSRLRAYTDGGRFQDSLRWLWGQAGDVMHDRQIAVARIAKPRLDDGGAQAILIDN